MSFADSEAVPLDLQQHERRRMAVQIDVLEQQVKPWTATWPN